jgi:hypothetical protein
MLQKKIILVATESRSTKQLKTFRGNRKFLNLLVSYHN